MYLPEILCTRCNEKYRATQNPDGSFAFGLCPHCPVENAWEDLVQKQRLDRERRRKR